MKKGILLITIIFLGCIIFSSCSIKTKNTILSESRNYTDFSYIDANNNFKSDSEASKYEKAHSNECVIWTVPIKEIENSKAIMLQAAEHSQVYANFDYGIDTKTLKRGEIITISGYIQGYAKGFLGEAAMWTLSNCRIEKTNSTDESALKDYINTSNTSNVSKETSSSTDTNSSKGSAASEGTKVSATSSSTFSFTPEEFKNNLLAKDNNFIVLPSFKSGSTDALDNLFYSYKSSSNSYSVNLCTKDSKVSLIEYSCTIQSTANVKSVDLMNDILYVVYGNKINDSYNSAAAYVKEFYDKNQAVNDYHTGSISIAGYTITLVTRNKNLNFKMIIQPN